MSQPHHFKCLNGKIEVVADGETGGNFSALRHFKKQVIIETGLSMLLINPYMLFHWL